MGEHGRFRHVPPLCLLHEETHTWRCIMFVPSLAQSVAQFWRIAHAFGLRGKQGGSTLCLYTEKQNQPLHLPPYARVMCQIRGSPETKCGASSWFPCKAIPKTENGCPQMTTPPQNQSREPIHFPYKLLSSVQTKTKAKRQSSFLSTILTHPVYQDRIWGPFQGMSAVCPQPIKDLGAVGFEGKD